ncbi:MAG: transposase [Peptococcaceae bacterium]|jgi:transposase-like protein|nr:transposase [Peptococcaceae bacterium]MDH7525855.1 transposase [Peptococcaceae bacterium]
MPKTELQKEWEIRIAEYRASGQTAKEWCAAHNVTPRQLWYWLRKFKNKEDASPVKPTRWLPVEVCEQVSMEQSNALLVKVGQAGIEVRPGFDPALLSQVVRILTTLC